jgi:hypothetical protein
MDSLTENPPSYRVEVSGWDEKENFFVEKTMLDWSDGMRRRIAVHAPVARDAVVFVRLAQQLGGGSSFPIPYRAVEATPERDGECTVLTVQQLQPKRAFRDRPEITLDDRDVA